MVRWGVAFQGWVVRAAHSWGTSEREIAYPAVSLELEKYLLSRYRFHIRVISDRSHGRGRYYLRKVKVLLSTARVALGITLRGLSLQVSQNE